MKKLFTGILLLVSINTFSQQPIFATISGGDLYSFDVTNCTRHFIGSTGQGFGDIAFTPDGQLWGIVGGELYNIDTTTANATLIGNTGVGAVSLVGLNDTTLLAEYAMKLYRINTNNATSTYIDTIGFQAAGDLTWYDDDLYMTTPLVKIVLNNSYSAILSVTPISLTVPTCEGAATASFVEDYNQIIGFNGPNLIKICQLDGSYQTLCPNLNIGGTPGAASIRLTTQSPQPITCEKTTGVENLSKDKALLLFPNPVTNELNIQTNINNQTQYKIYNLVGQIIKTGVLQSHLTTISIDNFSGGIYIIELTADKKYERQRFIVEK